MTIDDKIRDKKLQYNSNRAAAKISEITSGKTDKYEYLTGEKLLPTKQHRLIDANAAQKFSEYGVFCGPYFSVFGLNTEIYGVNLRIQSEYRKIRTRKNSAFGHF